MRLFFVTTLSMHCHTDYAKGVRSIHSNAQWLCRDVLHTSQNPSTLGDVCNTSLLSEKLDLLLTS